MAVFVVSVAQQKGGVGKSTLAAQLAVSCSGHGYRSKILDIDRQATLLSWAKMRDRLALDRLNDVDVESGSGWRLPYIVQRLSKDYDLLFIDGPSGRNDDFSAMIDSADLVLLPCQPTGLDLWATKTLLEGNPRLREKAIVVLNRMPPRGKAAALIREKIERLSWPMARQLIGNRQAYAATMGMGLGVSEVAAQSVAGREIDALANEVLERVASSGRSLEPETRCLSA